MVKKHTVSTPLIAENNPFGYFLGRVTPDFSQKRGI